MKRLFWLVALLFLLVSCRELVLDEFPSFNQKPALNAILRTGETLLVHVSLADKLDTNQINVVSNARVDVYLDNEFAHTMNYVANGVYSSNLIVDPLKEYTCKINVPGFDEIISSQLIPAKPSITAIEHINIAGKDEEGTSYPAVKITFRNNLSITSYFEIELRYIVKFREEVYERIANVINIVDPVILNEGLSMALFSNEIINDSLYTITLNYTTGGAGSRNGGPMRTQIYPFVVELRNVTYEYYRFKKQLYLYEKGRWADGITSGMTNANVYSNIENGYGVFVGYSTVVSDTITPNTDGYYD